MKKNESEKKIEKIFLDLYEGYKSGKNWDKALNEVNSFIKKIQEDSERKLKIERRTLISKIDLTEKNLKKTLNELNSCKKIKIPNLQREILRLSQKNNDIYGSN